MNERWLAHARVHALEGLNHEIVHANSAVALDKAEGALDRRLEAMNEFRTQLSHQSQTFVTRDVFDTQLAALNDKLDAVITGMAARHDASYEALRKDLQTERESRKQLEGSMSTWRWIASFLGASGVGGVILLFATRP